MDAKYWHDSFYLHIIMKSLHIIQLPSSNCPKTFVTVVDPYWMQRRVLISY